MRNRLAASVVMIAAALVGCTAQRPVYLSEPLPDAPDYARVSADPAVHAGRRVRWGGTIVRVENQAQESVLEVVERALNENGRPQAGHSGGRFLARALGFLDPLVYTQGREVTVVGTVAGAETGKIGAFEYLYPVLRVEHVHLWDVPVRIRPPPYWYDPYWYDPWYPWYPWWRRPYW